MAVKWLVQFPQAREAPSEIRSALRALDPTAEVIFLSPNRWLVGRVRPTSDSVRIAGGMLRDASKMSVRAASATSRRARVALAMLGLQGFRPVAEYTLSELDSRVVRDFQISQWRMRHTTDDQLFREIDQPDEERRARNAEAMRDRHLAGDAYRTAFTSNFGRAVSTVTNTDVNTRSSVRTRVFPSSS